MAVPKLRFKADDGSQFSDWEEHKIKEFVTESNILGHTGKEAKKLTVKLWAKGVVPKENVFSGSENTQYYIRHSGQLMYGKLDFLNCAFGIVPPELDGYESTLDAPAFDMHDISDKFLLSYVTRKIFYKKNGDIANGSRKAKRIHPDVFGEMPIMVPSLPEQQKIAEFLSTIDTVIEKQKETVSAWEERKKGVMQKLFSQEVRFKADDGSNFPEWEEKKFSEIFEKTTNKNTCYGTDKIISVANMYYKEDASVSNEDYLKTYNVMLYGDIAFEGHVNKEYSHGRFVLNDIGDGIVSHIFDVFHPKNLSLYSVGFWKEYIRHEPIMGRVLVRCTKSSTMMRNLVAKEFLQELVPVPCLAEQQKIADCLSSLDEVIEKQKATLAAWEELKKGLLQQMFV